MTALVAARELGREIGATVIYNLITSRAVPELIVERGGTALRSRVGHSYIKGLMADTGAIFGGEHSAHYYFRDFWGADSGMLAALHVLAALGEQDRPLSEMMADYQRYEASGELNFTVTDAPACVDAVLKSFDGRIRSLDHLDGVTVDLGDGCWFNLRTSNTEPLLRLNVEARTTDEVDEIVGHVAALISSAVGLSRRAVGLPSPRTVGPQRERPHATIDLDDVEGLLAADREGLLRAASMAGAQMRATAVRAGGGSARPAAVGPSAPHGESGSPPAARPRRPGSCSPPRLAVRWLRRSCSAAEVPPWIGALDVLVVAGDDPADPALVAAAATGIRRGARVVVVAPDEGPLREVAAGRSVVLGDHGSWCPRTSG